MAEYTMPEGGWVWIDGSRRDDLPPMPRAVSDVMDEWLLREHGMTSGRHHIGHFLDLLYDRGYIVVKKAVADAQSYTTIGTMEIDRRPVDEDALTEGQIKAEDPTWTPPDDPDAPVRSLA
jgi:hypothetical protein